MFDVLNNRDYEFFRPLVTGWLAKIEAAQRGRSKWKELADECLMFYSKSAAAMWDPSYTRKFWKNVAAPRFRITINKAFEYVAVVGPNLIWDIPHRNVAPKKNLDIPQELIEATPELAQAWPAMQADMQRELGEAKLTSRIMQLWLNYLPQEQPEGGLEGANELAVVDALLTGRGCLWTKPYSFPESNRQLVGSFHDSPYNLLIDPDFDKIDTAKWIAKKHVETTWEVERRFKLPPGSLKNRASLESSWMYGELQGSEDKGNPHRAIGHTNDLIVWYEIWSKTGPGARMTGIEEALKNQLEETVGDYAYIAVCAECPYPLNCPTQVLRDGLTSAGVKQKFAWPVPLWKDSRWPVECCDLYPSTDSAWPIPPLSAGMGELKFMTFLVPWLCNRIYSSSRDFWAVMSPHYEHYKKYLEEGLDQQVIPMAPGVTTDDIRKAITVLQQPETRFDVWKIWELVSNLFDKRVGLTPSVYGQNEDGTQNRTAEETQAKQRAVGVRQEYLQKKVKAWQGRVASAEALLTWLFTKPEDTVGVLGRSGSMLFDRYIKQQPFETVMRQMEYTIAASSIRRPDRDRDIASFNQFTGLYLPIIQANGEMTGDFTPANGVARKFGELHDMDVEGLILPPPQPPDPELPLLEKQKLTAETRQMNAEATKAEAEAQANPAEIKMLELAMEQQGEEQRLAMEVQKMQVELQMKMAELRMKLQAKQAEMQMDAQQHAQELQQRQQEAQVDLTVKRATGAQQIAMGRQQMIQSDQQHRQQMAQGAQANKAKLQQGKQQTQAKVSAIKATAAAKPKPTNGSARK